MARAWSRIGALLAAAVLPAVAGGAPWMPGPAAQAQALPDGGRLTWR